MTRQRVGAGRRRISIVATGKIEILRPDSIGARDDRVARGDCGGGRVRLYWRLHFHQGSSAMSAVEKIARAHLHANLPAFRPGDTVRVHVKIKEGDKTRVQPFEGVVIGRRGRDVQETFTVRKV